MLAKPNATQPATAASPAGPARNFVVRIDVEIADLIPKFLLQMQEASRSMGESASKGDLNSILALAHQIVGVGGSYGFHEITHIGRELEETIRKADGTAVTRLIAELDAYLQRVEVVYE
jgi:HPt (histidine-containing phosphotransfer) domain-containing protein